MVLVMIVFVLKGVNRLLFLFIKSKPRQTSNNKVIFLFVLFYLIRLQFKNSNRMSVVCVLVMMMMMVCEG